MTDEATIIHVGGEPGYDVVVGRGVLAGQVTLKLRYKAPDGDTTKLVTWPVKDSGQSFAQTSTDFQFAAAVAQFGMLLRGSPHRGDATYGSVAEIAASAVGPDANGYRQEFVKLVKQAEQLAPPTAAAPARSRHRNAASRP